MSKPELLYLRWRGKDVRIRHDDPLLTRYSPVIATLQFAMTITTEVATLRLVMATRGDRIARDRIGGLDSMLD